jgi:ribosomal-protein-alanine N-acetyltransferase
MPEQSVLVLEMASVALRLFDTDDIDSLTRDIFADPHVTRYLPRTTVSPRQRAERMISRLRLHWREHGFGVWAVTGRAGGKFIGYCGLNLLPELDVVEVDYGLGRAYWGQGIATEAARAALRFGFTEVGLKRLIGLVVPENLASRRVLCHGQC